MTPCGCCYLSHLALMNHNEPPSDQRRSVTAWRGTSHFRKVQCMHDDVPGGRHRVQRESRSA